LITGATSGIGAAFARALAPGRDLVLVARDGDRLAARAAELRRPGAEITVLAADLTTDEGCDKVAARLADAGNPVDLLVNNAGMSINASLLRSTVEQQERLLRLNVHAVLRLTLAALPGMVERRGGAVINVSSVAGFASLLPGSTYPAGKAWVTSFSESTGLAVRRHGVRVMALCPGWVRTEFHERAGIDVSRLPGFLWLDADSVVRDGLRDLRRGKLISVPDWKYKIAVGAMRHLPPSLLRRAGRRGRGRIGRDHET
jgi:short-subunit dehydrogenase